MRKLLLFMLLTIVGIASGYAQEEDNTQQDKWYFGLGGGFHTSKLKFSNLDKDLFPTSKYLNSGVFSIFAQYEFGKEKHFAIRPEFIFLRRGGKLTEIGKDLYDDEEIDDINYTLKSKYWDIRIQVIYNFCKSNCVVRPYIYVAPILGFSTGGNIKLQEEYADNSYSGYELGLSKTNMNSYYFAGAIGLGAKYQFKVKHSTCFLGVEANYECGFTNTYSDKEKDGKAYTNEDYSLYPSHKIKGTRKLSGFEIKATLGIPFSIFKKKQPIQKQPEPVVMPVAMPVVEAPIVETKPCYSLEEINDMMIRGEAVEGKTICAIDDAITFDFGKSTIKKSSYEYLDKLAKTLTRTNARIEVKGHTDNVGSEDFNLKLSKERAQSVVNYLIEQRVPKEKLSYSYYGMSKPLTTNDTEKGRSMNRRVEFEILK